MIIVGTHLDRIPAQKTHKMKEFYNEMIKDLYDKPGYPQISAIMCVSCTTKEGIRELQEKIHGAAVNAVDPDIKEHVIGQLVSSEASFYTCSFPGLILYRHPMKEGPWAMHFTYGSNRGWADI